MKRRSFGRAGYIDSDTLAILLFCVGVPCMISFMALRDFYTEKKLAAQVLAQADQLRPVFLADESTQTIRAEIAELLPKLEAQHQLYQAELEAHRAEVHRQEREFRMNPTMAGARAVESLSGDPRKSAELVDLEAALVGHLETLNANWHKLFSTMWEARNFDGRVWSGEVYISGSCVPVPAWNAGS